MKNSDTPMGQAFKIAIMIGGGEGEDSMHEGGESKPTETGEHKAPNGPKPKDAPKLPEGWHYMPDGKVMADSEHEGNEEYE